MYVQVLIFLGSVRFYLHPPEFSLFLGTGSFKMLQINFDEFFFARPAADCILVARGQRPKLLKSQKCLDRIDEEKSNWCHFVTSDWLQMVDFGAFKVRGQGH